MTAVSRRVMSSIAIAALLALAPASALADGGAGDNQYQDPLVAPIAKKKQKTTSSAPAASAPAAASAPPASAPAASTAPASTTSATQLPRTGAPAGLVGLIGLTLLASGMALRRRTAPR